MEMQTDTNKDIKPMIQAALKVCMVISAASAALVLTYAILVYMGVPLPIF